MTDFSYGSNTYADTAEADDLDVTAAEPETEEINDITDDHDSAESADTADDTAKKKGASRKAKKSATADRALIRRVAHKTETLMAATTDELELAGIVLGCQLTVVDVTVATMTAERGATAILDDLISIVDADEAFRAIEVMGLGDKLRPAWNVLAHLGVVSGRVPNDDLTTTKRIIEGLPSFTDEHRSRVLGVAELTKKN